MYMSGGEPIRLLVGVGGDSGSGGGGGVRDSGELEIPRCEENWPVGWLGKGKARAKQGQSKTAQKEKDAARVLGTHGRCGWGIQ